MNGGKFDEVVQKQIKWCLDILLKKGAEYGSDDRLHNFKIAAGIEQCTEEQALAGMMTKHIVSIFDMCRAGVPFSEERWNEKIGDSINYLFLLRALIEDTGKVVYSQWNPSFKDPDLRVLAEASSTPLEGMGFDGDTHDPAPYNNDICEEDCTTCKASCKREENRFDVPPPRPDVSYLSRANKIASKTVEGDI